MQYIFPLDALRMQRSADGLGCFGCEVHTRNTEFPERSSRGISRRVTTNYWQSHCKIVQATGDCDKGRVPGSVCTSRRLIVSFSYAALGQP